MNKLKESKGFYVVISILIACAMWLYVVSELNPDSNTVINDVPITVTGQDVLDSRGLMITKQNIQSLDLRVSGKRNSLVKLTDENVTVTVDVSSIANEGEHDLRCNIALPSTITTGTVTVNNRETYRVKLTVEKRASKTVEVRGNFQGSVAEGYQADSFVLSPSSLTISGPAGVINQIDYAVVTLNVTDLNSTYSGILPFEFVTYEGKRIADDDVESSNASIYVVYPIVMVKEVPLEVDFVAGGGATEKDVTYTISPSSIQVSGKEADVSRLEKIDLGSIDLAEVGGTGTFRFPIQLTGDVSNESGVTEATVTVQVSGLSSKVLETTNIETINPPAGYTAEAVTQSLSVAIRGPEEAVAQIQPHQLRVVADLSEQSPSVGQFKVPVKIYLDGTDEVGVVGCDYSISVTMSR